MAIKTPAQQLFVLQGLPITTRATFRCGKVTWEGRLRPTPLSREYLVRIVYSRPYPPRVSVLEPALEPLLGRALPHVFDDDRLCLCLPHEWSHDDLIARTTVPWTAEWLLHYELWRATGEWLGGGHGSASEAKESVDLLPDRIARSRSRARADGRAG